MLFQSATVSRTGAAALHTGPPCFKPIRRRCQNKCSPRSTAFYTPRPSFTTRLSYPAPITTMPNFGGTISGTTLRPALRCRIYRFIAFTAETVLLNPGKTLPSDKMIVQGFRATLGVLMAEHPTFHLTLNGGCRLESLVNRLVKERKFWKGPWNPGEWVGFRVILLLPQTWVEDALDLGC